LSLVLTDFITLDGFVVDVGGGPKMQYTILPIGRAVGVGLVFGVALRALVVAAGEGYQRDFGY